MKFSFLCLSKCFFSSSAINDEEAFRGVQILQNVNAFSYNELKSATNGFRSSNKIGEGGFGSVYKGRLQDGRIVAVKVLSADSKQGDKEFMTEIASLSYISHENLVKLHGGCVDGPFRILVYEYMKNNNLSRLMLGLLGWEARRKICLGIARGLVYIHEEVQPHIVHRDIKASNIVLDENFNPKISDFGLSKLFPDNISHITTKVAGTLGYLAPEYAISGRLTRKSDVYSFGVLLLEIVSGRSAVDFDLQLGEYYLVEKAWEMYKSDKLIDLVDSNITNTIYSVNFSSDLDGEEERDHQDQEEDQEEEEEEEEDEAQIGNPPPAETTETEAAATTTAAATAIIEDKDKDKNKTSSKEEDSKKPHSNSNSVSVSVDRKTTIATATTTGSRVDAKTEASEPPNPNSQAQTQNDNGNGIPTSKDQLFIDDNYLVYEEGSESGTEEDQSNFMKELELFFKERSLEFKPPKFYGEGLNCLKLWRAVTRLGGYDKVTSCKLWRQVGESFKPPKTCTTVSWTFRGFYEKALLDYERQKTRGGELSVPVSSHAEPSNVDTQASGSGRARRDAAARAMQGWHSQRLLGNGEVSDPIIKDKNSISMQKREKQLKNIAPGLLKRKKQPYTDHAVKATRTKASKTQLDTAVVDVGPPAEWVKINVQRTKDCYEVYALVPGLLREEVRVQSDPAGRLVISGEPEQPDNPWGVTPFKKVVSLPSRIDPHQTSAVVTLHGQLFVRVPFEQSE